MKHGIYLPQGWRPDLQNGQTASEDASALLATAVEAEAAGLDSVWLFDHLDPDPPGSSARTLECWTGLAAVAAVTSRVQVGSLVTCIAYRNVPLLASMAVTTSAISNGRLVLGLGAGWLEREFRAFGFAFDPLPRRIDALRNGLGQILQRWNVMGVSTGAIPLWLGGQSDAIWKMAVRSAQGVNLIGPPDVIASMVRAVMDECVASRRDPSDVEISVVWRPVLCDDHNRLRMARTIAQRTSERPEDILGDRFHYTFGNSARLTEVASQYAEVGVQHLIAYLPQPHTPDLVSQFADTVARRACKHANGSA